MKAISVFLISLACFLAMAAAISLAVGFGISAKGIRAPTGELLPMAALGIRGGIVVGLCICSAALATTAIVNNNDQQDN